MTYSHITLLAATDNAAYNVLCQKILILSLNMADINLWYAVYRLYVECHYHTANVTNEFVPLDVFMLLHDVS